MRVINNLPFGEKSTVIDSLDSDSTTYALSANQGKVLDTRYSELEESLVTNYSLLVSAGTITIDDVPEKSRSRVQELLNINS